MRKKNWRSYFFQAHNVSCQAFLRLSSWSNTSYNFLFIFLNYLATCRKFHLKISTERNYYAQMWTKTNTHTFMWFSRKNLAQVFLFFFPFQFSLSYTPHILLLSDAHTHTLSLTHLLTQKVNSANNAKFKFSFLFNTNLENELEPMTAEQANVIIYIYIVNRLQVSHFQTVITNVRQRSIITKIYSKLLGYNQHVVQLSPGTSSLSSHSMSIQILVFTCTDQW